MSTPDSKAAREELSPSVDTGPTLADVTAARYPPAATVYRVVALEGRYTVWATEPGERDTLVAGDLDKDAAEVVANGLRRAFAAGARWRSRQLGQPVQLDGEPLSCTTRAVDYVRDPETGDYSGGLKWVECRSRSWVPYPGISGRASYECVRCGGMVEGKTTPGENQ